MNEPLHILLDIEALGLRPGSAIFELAAVAFWPESGRLGETFEILIRPAAPFTADLSTLEFHREQGTWPRLGGDLGAESLGVALSEFAGWVRSLGEVENFWSWGSTYDFPLLTAGYEATQAAPPWDHWQCCCARTVWRTAFGRRKHGHRPHRALDDALAAARDLLAAMAALGVQTPTH